MSYLGVGQGIGAGGELTLAEELFVQNISGLSFATGDLLYHNGTNITRLAIGTTDQVLRVSGGAPAWGADIGEAETIPLTNLSDVRILSPVTGNVLYYNGASWVNSPITGIATTTINADATSAQIIAVGSSGTDFAIVDNGVGTHTFNLPSASATARGLVTTAAQTFAGVKTFSAPILGIPTSGTLTNCTGLPAASVVAGTFGTGAYVIDTSLTNPILIGGTGTTQTLTYKTTTGIGAAGADHIFQVGNNGTTEAMRILNSGKVGIGVSPTNFFDVTSTEALISSLTTSSSTGSLSVTGGTYGRITFGGNAKIHVTNTLQFNVPGDISFTSAGEGAQGANEHAFISNMTDGAAAVLISWRSTSAISLGKLMNWYSDNGTTEVASLSGAGILQLDGGLNLDSTFDIDSGTGANALDTTATTSDAFTITGSSLTTGDLLRVYSNSTDVGARNLLEIVNDNTLATGAVGLRVQQDSTADIIRAFDGATQIFTVADGGIVYINDTANATMTTGLTINQGVATNEIISLKNSNVAHGVTGVTETDTYGALITVGGAEGGVALYGISETTTGMQLYSVHTTDNTTKSTAGLGNIILQATLKSGTGVTVCGADANLVAIRNNTTTSFIFDAEGSGHQNLGTAWTEFDDYDDSVLLETLNATIVHDPIKGMFREFTEENKEILARNRIITYNEDGQHFINWSRANMLTIGAVRQLYKKLENAYVKIGALEQKLLTA